MRRTIAVVFGLMLTIGTSIAVSPAPASAAPTQEGKEWRELIDTVGLSRAAIATVCPTDGVTPCNGTVGGKNLTGWVWATAPQVLGLMDAYSPGLATLEPPAVYGISGFFASSNFFGAMRPTGYIALTYFSSEWAYGWTASLDPDGLPIGGFATNSHSGTGTTADGSFGLGSRADGADNATGVFLWRTAGLDYTPPVVAPSVYGTLGSSGWYRSNVSISWSVVDPESAILTRVGCANATLSTNTVGRTYTCTATSAGLGGPTTKSVTVKRDVGLPTITCGVTPTFTLTQYPAYVSGTVNDAISGPASPSVTGLVNTSTLGLQYASLVAFDRAGNQRTKQCPYKVVTTTCQGKAVTIMGTAASETINGTSGNDVIHGLYGHDRINGLGGNDTICGGDGWDTISGDDGLDLVDGGPGNDDIYGGYDDDDLNGGADYDSIDGEDGRDRCTSGEARMSSCSYIY